MALEDFTTYSETDPTSKITVTSTKVDVAAIPEEDDAFVVDDKGVGHFDGDFEHLTEFYLNSSTTNGISALMWQLANSATMVSTGGGPHQFVRAYDDSTPQACAGDATAQDCVNWNTDTLYYCIVERDESIGTYGTLYCYFYTDSGRTTLAFTSTQTLAVAKYDWRYIYAFSNYGNSVGSYVWTGYSQNFDLQEGGTGPAKLKTLNTVAKANVKTINGVAIASVKTIDTVV